jgi:hypothetical protein
MEKRLSSKAKGSSASQKFHAFFGTRISIIGLTRARHLYPPWYIFIRSSPLHSTPSHFFSDPLYYYFPIYAYVIQVPTFLQVSQTKPYMNSFSPYVLHAPQSHLSILRGIQVIKLLFILSSLLYHSSLIFFIEGPGSRCYGRTAASKAYCATLWERWRWWGFFCVSILMEQRWNELDRGKPKYSEQDLSQCHFVHHKFHMDRPGIKPGLPRWEAGN